MGDAHRARVARIVDGVVLAGNGDGLRCAPDTAAARRECQGSRVHRRARSGGDRHRHIVRRLGLQHYRVGVRRGCAVLADGGAPACFCDGEAGGRRRRRHVDVEGVAHRVAAGGGSDLYRYRARIARARRAREGAGARREGQPARQRGVVGLRRAVGQGIAVRILKCVGREGIAERCTDRRRLVRNRIGNRGVIVHRRYVDGHGVGSRAVIRAVVHRELEGRVAASIGVRRRGEYELVRVDVRLRDDLVRGYVRTVEFQVARALQGGDLHARQGVAAVGVREVEVRVRKRVRRVLVRRHRAVRGGGGGVGDRGHRDRHRGNARPGRIGCRGGRDTVADRGRAIPLAGHRHRLRGVPIAVIEAHRARHLGDRRRARHRRDRHRAAGLALQHQGVGVGVVVLRHRKRPPGHDDPVAGVGGGCGDVADRDLVVGVGGVRGDRGRVGKGHRLARGIAVVQRPDRHRLRRVPVAAVAMGEGQRVLVARHAGIGVHLDRGGVAVGHRDGDIGAGVAVQHHRVALLRVGGVQFGQGQRGRGDRDAVGGGGRIDRAVDADLKGIVPVPPGGSAELAPIGDAPAVGAARIFRIRRHTGDPQGVITAHIDRDEVGGVRRQFDAVPRRPVRQHRPSNHRGARRILQSADRCARIPSVVGLLDPDREGVQRVLIHGPVGHIDAGQRIAGGISARRECLGAKIVVERCPGSPGLVQIADQCLGGLRRNRQARPRQDNQRQTERRGGKAAPQTARG